MIQVRLHQVFPRIGLQTTPGRLEIETTDSQITVEATAAEMEIKNPKPRLEIDQGECFADAGLLSFARFRPYYAQKGQQAASDYTARYSSEGDQLAAIEKGGKIEDIVTSGIDGDFDFNVAAVPSHRPEIKFDTPPVGYNFRPKKVDVSASPSSVRYSYERSRLEIYMDREGSLDIDFVGGNFDETA